MKKIAFILLFLTVHSRVLSINFDWKARIDSVPVDGFYKIILSPEVIAESNPDYSDIRIYDSKKKEIPYIFKEDSRIDEKSSFKEYNVVENQYNSRQGVTRIVIHNSGKRIISSFYLIVKNADAEKYITLRGSDNLSNWFIIKRSYPVHAVYSSEETSEIRIFDFPKSNYEYFELLLNDKWKDPLKVLKVGYYDTELSLGKYSKVPIQEIHQTDSSAVRKTFLTIKLNKPYEIDRLHFFIKSPDMYHRNSELGIYQFKHKRKWFYNFDHFILSSNSESIFDFDKLREPYLMIAIENNDNPPLKIDSITAFQLNKYLLVKVKAKESYTLMFGNRRLQKPDYDLKYFEANIPEKLSVLGVGKNIFVKRTGIISKFNLFNSTFLWIVIGIIIIILGFLTIRLTREISKREQTWKN